MNPKSPLSASVCVYLVFSSVPIVSSPFLYLICAPNSSPLMTPQLQPKHCAETISAAHYRKQKKQMPKKGEVQKEKPGAESLRKDRTLATKSALLFASTVIALSVQSFQLILLVKDDFRWILESFRSAQMWEFMRFKIVFFALCKVIKFVKSILKICQSW